MTGKVSGGFGLDARAAGKSDLVEYNFDASPTLTVPGDWNSQDDQLLYYEGTLWYRRTFDAPSTAPGERLFVYFGAANYESAVYLNGRLLGKHTGGFTPFNFEITSLVQPTKNSLVVRVNNQRKQEGVPTVNTDWWNYGGITRDVLLVKTPATFIRDFRVRLKPGTTNIIEARVQLDGADKTQTVKVALPGLRLSASAKPNQDGVAELELPAPALPLWSPQSPTLHEVTVASGTDSTRDRIGFRTIATRGREILLNGQPVFLRGICIHEENPLRGTRAWSEDDARLLLGWAKELNCNFVRLAHYPHNEHMARLADEMGILAWEEIPVYWTIAWTNNATLKLAQAQLTDLITRDANRASVVVWSVANETPVSEARTKFLKVLVDTARSLDGTRLVSAAMEVHSDKSNPNLKIVDDPFGEFTDLLGFNEYIGWYDGTPDKLEKVTWQIKYNKPVFISEFGAGAKKGYHGDALTRFSEEYQADLYSKTFPMLDKIPGFSGCTPWIIADFRSPRRQLPGIQDGWNRKGVLDQKGEKKQAWSVLKNYYDERSQRSRDQNR
jgi:beta-glucuronidase